MKLVLLGVVFLSACSSHINEEQKSVSFPEETKVAMAKCSGQVSDSQKVFVEGSYLEHKAAIGAGKDSSIKGLVIDQEGMDSADKVKLMAFYHKCMESHEQKKK